jgi:hypothetical protein
MDVAAVRVVDYLSTEETIIRRGVQTEAKRGGLIYTVFRPALGPSFACQLLLSIGPCAPLHVGFGYHYPRDQDRGSCRMNFGLLSWSSGISCSCTLVLGTFGSKFILYLHTNEAP